MRRKTIMNDIYNPSEDESTKINNNSKERGNEITDKVQHGNQKTKKLLECHAFVCNSQADAIAIAAQLYQALVETIRKFNRHAAENTNRRNVKETLNANNSCRVSFNMVLNLFFKDF